MQLKFIFILVFLFSGNLFGQGIIIDHSCADVSEIPLNIIDSIKQNIKFQWCGQSHSHQLTTGLDLLESDFPELEATIGQVELPESNNSLCVMDGLNWGEYAPQCAGYWAFVGPNSYWAATTAHGNVKQTLIDCHPTINISAFEWCSELEDHSAAYVQSYLDSMAVYEQIYSDVTFIYTTGNSQSGGLAGYNRHQNNEIIRQHCIDNNKVLYDFGDLDCWSNGEFSFYLYEGDTIPIQHPDYDEDPEDPTQYYHTNALGCKNKAKAGWYMFAILSGWKREINLDLKVYLEGSFNDYEMTNNLNNSNTLPLHQPFNVFPWNYNGDENVLSIPNENIVDWVLVELRDATQVEDATTESIVGVKAGFILNNGSIVDIDGINPLSFDISISDNLYIVIRHLNHLDVIGANPANLSEGTYSYDFSSSEYQTYGGAAGHKELTPGIWGMISGDGNADGIINMNDKNVSWINQTGQSGYKTADFDMGGKVDNRDKNEFWLDNISMESQVPD